MPEVVHIFKGHIFYKGLYKSSVLKNKIARRAAISQLFLQLTYK